MNPHQYHPKMAQLLRDVGAEAVIVIVNVGGGKANVLVEAVDGYTHAGEFASLLRDVADRMDAESLST